jgi:hypothetical protein
MSSVIRPSSLAHHSDREPVLAFPAAIDAARAILSDVSPTTAEGLDDRQPDEAFHVVIVSAGGACVATASDESTLN